MYIVVGIIIICESGFVNFMEYLTCNFFFIEKKIKFKIYNKCNQSLRIMNVNILFKQT